MNTRAANSYTTTFGYVAGGHGTKSTTPLVASISQPGMNFSYTYDNRGNITSETRNGVTVSYEYDGLGQLTRVNDPHENATWVYNYDRGNITSKVKYAYCKALQNNNAFGLDATTFLSYNIAAVRTRLWLKVDARRGRNDPRKPAKVR